MFINKTFQNDHLRKLVIAFGAMFSNIVIERKDADKNVVQPLRVPLTFSPKDRMLTRIEEVSSFEQGRGPFEITLPRMGFNLTGIQYDASRNINKTNPVAGLTTNGGVFETFYSAPYIAQFQLSTFTTSIDDCLHITEQILPYFKPDLSVTINEMPSLGVKRDIQFTLNGVEYDFQYDGSLREGRRIVMADLNFSARMNFFGHVGQVGLIKKIVANVFASETDGAFTRITTEATEDATPENIEFTQSIEELFAE
jgi:hypothetical protein